MVSPRDDSTSIPVDPTLHAILADIDSLRVRVLSYIQADQSKQVYVRKLETDLATVQQELVESRKENERMKEANSVNFDASGHTPGRSGQTESEMLRRHLRHSRKTDTNEDPPSPTQASVMGSSPATQYQDAHFQPMAPVDLNTSAPIPDPAATPQAVRTKRNDPFQSNAATPLRAARPSRHQTSQPVDEPEQASPVQRTPKIKKSQSLGASQVASSSTRLEGPDVPGRSSAPPSAGHATRPHSTHSEGRSKGSAEDTVPRIRGNGSSTAKPAVRTSEDPYETDVTYNGAEEVRSKAETSYRQAQPSDVAKGKRRAAPVSEATPAYQIAPEIYPRLFPENYVKLYGALRLEKMFQRLDCEDAIERLSSEALKENTSFHLSVHGEHIFVKDPISLGSPTQLCLLTWGYPRHHDAIRDRIWGSGDERLPALDYHTFVFCCTQNSNKLRWYYIGKLRWAECETAPKWPRYHANAKKSLASKLAQSCEVGEDEAISNIENGEWQQLCIELTSNEELASTSEGFLLSNFPGAKKGALKKNTAMTSI